jgi:hypothetical protein
MWLPGLHEPAYPLSPDYYKTSARIEVAHTLVQNDGSVAAYRSTASSVQNGHEGAWLYAVNGSGTWWDPGRRLVKRNAIDAAVHFHGLEEVIERYKNTESRSNSAASNHARRWRVALGNHSWSHTIRMAIQGAECFELLAMVTQFLVGLKPLTSGLSLGGRHDFTRMRRELLASGIDSVIMTGQSHLWPRFDDTSQMQFRDAGELVAQCRAGKRHRLLHIVPEIIDLRHAGPSTDQLLRKHTTASADGSQPCSVAPSGSYCTSCSPEGRVLCDCDVPRRSTAHKFQCCLDGARGWTPHSPEWVHNKTASSMTHPSALGKRPQPHTRQLQAQLHSPRSAPSVDLVMSVFVTESRSLYPMSRGDQISRHRYDRFEVFMYTLQSYARLPLDRVYLYVELDDGLRNATGRRLHLRDFSKALFGERLITLQHRRLTRQQDWQDEWNHTIAPPHLAHALDESNRLIFFCQNDDHPFIDPSLNVLNEGIDQLRADASLFKSLLMTHWGEAVGLISKQDNPVMVGSYVYAQITMTDSCQIFSLPFLRYLLTEVHWSKPLKRLDEMYRMKQIFGKYVGSRHGGMITTSTALHRMYVPLREQCRKFDAYMSNAKIPYAVVPQLVLPPEANTWKTTLATNVTLVLSTLGDTLWSRMRPLGNGTMPPREETVARAVELSARRNEVQSSTAPDVTSPAHESEMPGGVYDRASAAYFAPRRIERKLAPPTTKKGSWVQIGSARKST